MKINILIIFFVTPLILSVSFALADLYCPSKTCSACTSCTTPAKCTSGSPLTCGYLIGNCIIGATCTADCQDRETSQSACEATATGCLTYGNAKWVVNYGCCGNDPNEKFYQESGVWKCAINRIYAKGTCCASYFMMRCDYNCETPAGCFGSAPECGTGDYCNAYNYDRDSAREYCEGTQICKPVYPNPICYSLCNPNSNCNFAVWTDNGCCGDDGANDNFVYTGGQCVNGVPTVSSCDNTCNGICQSRVNCALDPDCTQGTNLCEGQTCSCDEQCASTSTGAGLCKNGVCTTAPLWMYINVRNSGDTGDGALKKTCGSTVSDFTCSYDDACANLGNGNFQGAALTTYGNATGFYPLSWSVWTSFTCGLADNAQFISQVAPPTNMNPGQTATVNVTMKNIGSTTWTKAAGYKLGSQNPEDNTNWGLSRVELDATDSIAPGQQKTFSFTITAPSAVGIYNFQWRMLKEGVAWFGEYSTNVIVTVAILNCGNGVADAGETCCNCPQDAGCSEGTRCMADCTCGPDIDGPVCIDNGNCEFFESCNCADCLDKQDSCLPGLVCCADNLCCCNPTPDGICSIDPYCKTIDPDCGPYFKNFTYVGDQNYFNVFWDARWPSLSQNPTKYINVTCILGCDPRTEACNCNPTTATCSKGQMCLPYPFYQPPGEGSCTVSNPDYGYAAKNKIICHVFNSTNASQGSWY